MNNKINLAVSPVQTGHYKMSGATDGGCKVHSPRSVMLGLFEVNVRLQRSE